MKKMWSRRKSQHEKVQASNISWCSLKSCRYNTHGSSPIFSWLWRVRIFQRLDGRCHRHFMDQINVNWYHSFYSIYLSHSLSMFFFNNNHHVSLNNMLSYTLQVPAVVDFSSPHLPEFSSILTSILIKMKAKKTRWWASKAVCDKLS